MKVQETARHLDSGHSTIPNISDHHLFCPSVRPDFKPTFQALFVCEYKLFKKWRDKICAKLTSVLSKSVPTGMQSWTSKQKSIRL